MKKKLQLCAGLVWVLLLTGFDQLTKYLAVTYLKGSDSVKILPGIFELSYLENLGAAFGIFQGQKVAFVIVTFILLVLLIFLYTQILEEKRYKFIRIIIVVLTAGAIGNFIDRCIHDYVIDFFYFSLIDFPIFNVADIYIVVSMAFFILLVFFYYKEEDLDNLMSKFPFVKKREKN